MSVYLNDLGVVCALGSGQRAVRDAEQRVAAMIGQAAAVIVASPGVWMAAIHPDDRDLFVQSTTQLLMDGAAVTRHYRVRHDETGEYQLIEDRLAATVDGKGDVTGYEAVITKAH